MKIVEMILLKWKKKSKKLDTKQVKHEPNKLKCFLIFI